MDDSKYLMIQIWSKYLVVFGESAILEEKGIARLWLSILPF